VDKALKTKTIVTEDWWGDSVEEQEFYSIDLITDSNLVIVIDNATWSNYFGVPYTMNGDIAELDYANIKPYMRGEWREVKDGETVPSPVDFSKAKEAFENRLKSFSNKAVEKAKAEFNVKETEEYKALEGELETTKSQFENAVESADEALKTENATLKENYANLEGELATAKGEIANQEEDFARVSGELETVKADNAGLLEFKANTEKAERISVVDSKIAEFSFEDAEVKEIKEKAYNAESKKINFIILDRKTKPESHLSCPVPIIDYRHPEVKEQAAAPCPG
jgi:predicted  nucleic acid-binding Zn-ribbon protein